MSYAKPALIHAADVCRDGKTYVLVYFDDGQNKHELELPVLAGATGRIEYEPPLLKSYSTGKFARLPWHEASALAHELKRLLRDPIGWGGVGRAAECIELLSLQGRLPYGA